MLTGFAGCMRDWLLMAFIRHPNCDDLRDMLGVDCSVDRTMAPLSVSVVDGDAVLADSLAVAEEKTEQYDAELLAELQKRCAWHYDSPTVGLTAKYGVSELVKAEEFSAPLRRPLFTRDRHGLSGAERGTALHTFMEYADFPSAANDLEAEITALEQRGKLTAQQAKAVRASDIAAFFKSDLYKRIAASASVQRERKFTVALADLQLCDSLASIGEQYAGTDGLLIGIMDLVFTEDDGYVLVDYKTDRNVTAEMLLERYSEQLRLYAAALALLTGKPVKDCCIYSLSLQKTIPVTVSFPMQQCINA